MGAGREETSRRERPIFTGDQKYQKSGLPHAVISRTRPPSKRRGSSRAGKDCDQQDVTFSPRRLPQRDATFRHWLIVSRAYIALQLSDLARVKGHSALRDALVRTRVLRRSSYACPASRFSLVNPARRVGAKQDGAQGRNRTTDTAIFSRMLYQLSYLGIAFRLNGREVRARVYRGHGAGWQGAQLRLRAIQPVGRTEEFAAIAVASAGPIRDP